MCRLARRRGVESVVVVGWRSAVVVDGVVVGWRGDVVVIVVGWRWKWLALALLLKNDTIAIRNVLERVGNRCRVGVVSCCVENI